MREEIPTWTLAAKVYWAFMWRSLLLAMVGGFILGMVAGALAAIIGVAEQAETIIVIGGMLIGIAAGIFIMHRLMTKGMKGYRLAAIKN